MPIDGSIYICSAFFAFVPLNFFFFINSPIKFITTIWLYSCHADATSATHKRAGALSWTRWIIQRVQTRWMVDRVPYLHSRRHGEPFSTVNWLSYSTYSFTHVALTWCLHDGNRVKFGIINLVGLFVKIIFLMRPNTKKSLYLFVCKNNKTKCILIPRSDHKQNKL